MVGGEQIMKFEKISTSISTSISISISLSISISACLACLPVCLSAGEALERCWKETGPRELSRQRVAKLDEPGEVRLSDGRQSGRQEEGRCLHRVVAKCRLNPSKVHLLQDRCGQTCWKDEQLHDRVRPTQPAAD